MSIATPAQQAQPASNLYAELGNLWFKRSEDCAAAVMQTLRKSGLLRNGNDAITQRTVTSSIRTVIGSTITEHSTDVQRVTLEVSREYRVAPDIIAPALLGSFDDPRDHLHQEITGSVEGDDDDFDEEKDREDSEAWERECARRTPLQRYIDSELKAGR